MKTISGRIKGILIGLLVIILVSLVFDAELERVAVLCVGDVIAVFKGIENAHPGPVVGTPEVGKWTAQPEIPYMGFAGFIGQTGVFEAGIIHDVRGCQAGTVKADAYDVEQRGREDVLFFDGHILIPRAIIQVHQLEAPRNYL